MRQREQITLPTNIPQGLEMQDPNDWDYHGIEYHKCRDMNALIRCYFKELEYKLHDLMETAFMVESVTDSHDWGFHCGNHEYHPDNVYVAELEHKYWPISSVSGNGFDPIVKLDAVFKIFYIRHHHVDMLIQIGKNKVFLYESDPEVYHREFNLINDNDFIHLESIRDYDLAIKTATKRLKAALKIVLEDIKSDGRIADAH